MTALRAVLPSGGSLHHPLPEGVESLEDALRVCAPLVGLVNERTSDAVWSLVDDVRTEPVKTAKEELLAHFPEEDA